MGGLVWFFIAGHSMPAYARYIPGDATAVVTINTKRIATDILLGGELKQDTALGPNKTFLKWKKASEENGGLGISMTSDILLFTCFGPAEKQLYGALVIKLDDEQTLLRFFRKELPKLLDTAFFKPAALTETKTYKMVSVSTGPFADDQIFMGFNQEVIVLLKAESHGWTSDRAAKELDRIFNEPKENSIAAVENFRKSERRPADITVWFNYNHRQFHHLMNQKKDTASRPGYVNAWLDFNKGAVDLTVFTIPSNASRVPVFRKSHAENDFLKLIAADKFMGLLHADIDFQNLLNNLNTIGNEKYVERMAGQWGLTSQDIASSFDGKVDLALNGFVHYKKKYIDYTYDADFNKIEIEKYRDERMPGFLLKLGMNGSTALLSLFPKLSGNKRIAACQNGYRLNSDIPVYFYPVGNNLYMSSSDKLPKDQAEQAVHNPEIQSLADNHSSSVFCDLKSLHEAMQKEFPSNDQQEKKVWDRFKSVSFTADEVPGTRTELGFSLKFSEAKTNALVQLINLFQEMQKHPF